MAAPCQEPHGSRFAPVLRRHQIRNRAVEVDDSYAYFTAGGGNHERLRVDKTGGHPRLSRMLRGGGRAGALRADGPRRQDLSLRDASKIWADPAAVRRSERTGAIASAR